MRVLYIVYSPIIGGATKVLLDLIKILITKKISPIVITSQNSKVIQVYRSAGIEVKETGMPLLTVRNNLLGFVSYLYYLITFTFTAVKLVRENKVDIIHANSFISALYGIFCALLTRRPMIWHAHEILPMSLFNKFFIRLAGWGSSRIICVSEAVRRNLLEFGVAGGKCVVIYNSVSPGLFSGENLRKEFGIEKETLLVGMIGQITWLKGQLILIKAIPEIIKHFPETKFIFVGDIMVKEEELYREELHKAVKDLGFNDKVVFTGFRDDALSIMSALDVVVLPSIYPDSLPTVILEAMAMGRPVVASEIGGVPEMISSGVNGVLVPPGNHEAISEAICKLLGNPELRYKFGGAGKRIIEERFSPKKSYEEVIDIYQELVDNTKLYFKFIHAIAYILRKIRLIGYADYLFLAINIIKNRRSNKTFRAIHIDFLLPPAHLAFDAYNNVDWQAYFKSGADQARIISDFINSNIVKDKIKICEWGCGPGRVIRHLKRYLKHESIELFGSDYNRESIEWCNKNIGGIIFTVNDLKPHLPFEKNFFDCVYALSVFTHLSESLNFAWIEELKRIVKPNGLIIITTHSDSAKDRLLSQERKFYNSGELVVKGNVIEGKKWFLAYHPEDFVRNKLLRGCDIIFHGQFISTQDIWVARNAKKDNRN